MGSASLHFYVSSLAIEAALCGVLVMTFALGSILFVRGADAQERTRYSNMLLLAANMVMFVLSITVRNIPYRFHSPQVLKEGVSVAAFGTRRK